MGMGVYDTACRVYQRETRGSDASAYVIRVERRRALQCRRRKEIQRGRHEKKEKKISKKDVLLRREPRREKRGIEDTARSHVCSARCPSRRLGPRECRQHRTGSQCAYVRESENTGVRKAGTRDLQTRKQVGWNFIN